MSDDNLNEEEVELQYSFTAAYEIDLDYEFNAARFFDFGRAESPLEAHQAEVWFDSAGSHPPSPFVLKLVPVDEILMENSNISPKSKGVEDVKLVESDNDIEMGNEISAPDMNSRDDVQDKGISTTKQIGSRKKLQKLSEKLPSGLTFYNHMVNDINSKAQTKMSLKPSFPRVSTLMKPTSSQLAKQNHPPQSVYSRSNTPFLEKTNKSSSSNCGIENQAAKRQKLEGGLLLKVEGELQRQQTTFVHKEPKRDRLVDGSTPHIKPRITIPREPDLETAHRAQRTRPKTIKEAADGAPVVRRFKALPLNRKILEAPALIPKRSTPHLPNFQEFHLKTSERALQHGSAVSQFTVPSDHSDKDLHKYATSLASDCGNREPSRTSILNASRTDGCELSHSFKALPLNKKILASKGDIGVFRSSKKETTVPMAFNFQTGKRSHHNHPPTELFSKLSLESDTQRVASLDSKSPWSICISMKGSKENRWGFFQLGNEITTNNAETTPAWGKQQYSVD
ncbi:protein TPX2 [Sesamum alatum]|uniref:Protein TPX2 n=1 Tax=Sesamum alatum TaxID=300844 RepID=A0AAE1Y3W9_9LAMI|nr:protein TPX2 [Sesamum alatum]